MQEKKFIEIFDVNDWQVETDSGWEDVIATGKTIKYKVYEIKLENGISLRCADTHIVFKENYEECYVENLKIHDVLITQYGLSKIINIDILEYEDNMYDLEINSENHTYYTNGVLSHNSMWLGNMAAKSVMAGNNTAYITLELQEEIVNMRIGANLLNVPLDDYEALTKDQALLTQKLTNLKQRALVKPGHLHIKEFPSSTASANDISAYLKKTEEILGIKFDNVFIDYLNIMKNWRNPNSENTYLKIKNISEDVRAMGQENSWSIISVTQTNRSGWESNDLHITSIAESAGLLHTVDILFGICVDAEMKARGEYFLKCLANRVAGYENTRKKYGMDWKYARIEEDRNSPIEDMEFFISSVSAGHKKPRDGRSTTADIHAVISEKTKVLEPDAPSNIDFGNINITGEGLF